VNCYTCQITPKRGVTRRAHSGGRAGLRPTDEVIAYCRIGERSSHTWFVLTYLLGYPSMRNYDGSWTEWGNLVRAPIERAAA
jgi:thiosulfate/3-mercaptopyruvate sulfurtransferase